MRKTLLAATVVSLLAACTPAPTGPTPPEIVYGVDVCEACGMIISEARFAAATALDGGEALRFDDIGDMLAYHASRPEIDVRAWFVHDHPSETWLEGHQATFVQSSEIASPMGHGIVAFADPAEAEAYALEIGGEVFTFDEIRSRYAGP